MRSAVPDFGKRLRRPQVRRGADLLRELLSQRDEEIANLKVRFPLAPLQSDCAQNTAAALQSRNPGPNPHQVKIVAMSKDHAEEKRVAAKRSQSLSPGRRSPASPKAVEDVAYAK